MDQQDCWVALCRGTQQKQAQFGRSHMSQIPGSSGCSMASRLLHARVQLIL